MLGKKDKITSLRDTGIEPLKPRRRENLGVIFIILSIRFSYSRAARYSKRKCRYTRLRVGDIPLLPPTLIRALYYREVHCSRSYYYYVLRGSYYCCLIYYRYDLAAGYAGEITRQSRGRYKDKAAPLNRGVDLLRVGLNLATTAAVNVVYLASVVVLLLRDRYRLMAARTDLKERYFTFTTLA
ncbi:hypothetical protein BDZ85DRAFT_249875 [Elsinoe ampelina]|uniref:Uncharacterized protein n=1 Tax=Elsinoe ampelina TaxID=302913 RepID=A0A6A6GBH4_9PEZI|nr:hypothetical protein BDZ85DRAFT_249875 [Elsinoe ampelina]